MLKRVAAIFIALTLLAVFSASCKGKRKVANNSGDEGPARTPYVSKRDEGTITGTISFEGQAPSAQPLDPSGDAYCNANMTEKVYDYYKIKDGKIAEVLVYVQGPGVDNFSFPAPGDTPVLDQKGCRYTPRMLGLVAGQKLAVKNSDDTSHNIHPRPKDNPGWNQSQAPKAADIVKSFEKPEQIPVKCDVHPWMSATIAVFNHPCFSVSGADGKYTITGVPPGTYTLVFQHDKLGTKRESVTVASSGTVEKNITFGPGGASAPAMQVGPPLVLPHLK